MRILQSLIVGGAETGHTVGLILSQRYQGIDLLAEPCEISGGDRTRVFDQSFCHSRYLVTDLDLGSDVQICKVVKDHEYDLG